MIRISIECDNIADFARINGALAQIQQPTTVNAPAPAPAVPPSKRMLVLDTIRQHPRKTAKRISKALGFEASPHITMLHQSGKVSRTGEHGGYRYEVRA